MGQYRRFFDALRPGCLRCGALWLMRESQALVAEGDLAEWWISPYILPEEEESSLVGNIHFICTAADQLHNHGAHAAQTR